MSSALAKKWAGGNQLGQLMTTENESTPLQQTIVVKVEPAPANPENVQKYIDISSMFLGIIIVLAIYKKIEQIFSSNDTY